MRIIIFGFEMYFSRHLIGPMFLLHSVSVMIHVCALHTNEMFVRIVNYYKKLLFDNELTGFFLIDLFDQSIQKLR